MPHRIRMIPILADNYAFLVIDDDTGVAAVVDPADPAAVLQVVREERIELTHLLNTHHHWDHTDGNEAMIAAFPQIRVYGPSLEAPKIPGLTDSVDHGEQIPFGDATIEVLATPGHTLGHVSYLLDSDLFCGDALFVGGCGRFFEGTPAQVVTSLVDTLATLPPETRVHCGHEYTLGNLAFAQHVEPENDAVRQKLAWAKKRRELGEPTVPSTIGEELSYNPFLRIQEKSVQDFVGHSDAAKVMGSLRQAKNEF